VSRSEQLQLTDGEAHAFAESAHILRFADSDGKVTTPITPDQLLAPRRWEDAGNDLWRTFNRVQENVLAGGLRYTNFEKLKTARSLDEAF
jgi:Domain of unknown function (DUF932)